VETIKTTTTTIHTVTDTNILIIILLPPLPQVSSKWILLCKRRNSPSVPQNKIGPVVAKKSKTRSVAPQRETLGKHTKEGLAGFLKQNVA